MYYEINVSKNYQHYFATHKRSLDIALSPQVKAMAEDFEKRFPKSEGFAITITRIDEGRHNVTSEFLGDQL